MKSVLFAVGFSVLLSACSGAESDTKKAVLGSLKDPDSAKFGKFTQIDERTGCLTVNARNSMGGYTGDQQAALIKVGDEWEFVMSNVSHNDCIETIKRTIKERKEYQNPPGSD